MSSVARQPILAGAALLLLASACLTGAFAQRTTPELPDTMRAPPWRGDVIATAPADGRVGDPLPAALRLVPEAAPSQPAVAPPAIPLAPPASQQDEAAADLSRDGAVGDLVARVPNVPTRRPGGTAPAPAAPSPAGSVGDLLPSVPNRPVPRPQQSELDGKAGEMLAYVPNVPIRRPGSQAIEAALAPGSARQSPMVMTVEEKQCRQKLLASGAKFREADRLTDPSGCLVPFPIVLSAIGGGIGIEPDATLNCETALALADYAKDIVSPEALASFGATLKTINHASAYVCRGRVGDGVEAKLSEHAFGNAIDIGSFVLAGGRRLDIRAYGPGEAVERDFMRKVRGAACGPWKTVLGPGTNADHATHFHFDLAQRRRGGTYCK
jgi:hypothetical protein